MANHILLAGIKSMEMHALIPLKPFDNCCPLAYLFECVHILKDTAVDVWHGVTLFANSQRRKFIDYCHCNRTAIMLSKSSITINKFNEQHFNIITNLIWFDFNYCSIFQLNILWRRWVLIKFLNYGMIIAAHCAKILFSENFIGNYCRLPMLLK